MQNGTPPKPDVKRELLGVKPSFFLLEPEAPAKATAPGSAAALLQDWVQVAKEYTEGRSCFYELAEVTSQAAGSMEDLERDTSFSAPVLATGLNTAKNAIHVMNGGTSDFSDLATKTALSKVLLCEVATQNDMRAPTVSKAFMSAAENLLGACEAHRVITTEDTMPIYNNIDRRMQAERSELGL